MSFLDLLQTIGDRLGILEAPEKAEAGAPGKIVTRTVTIAELKTEIRSEEVRSLAELPAELTVSFDKIFEAAGIAAPTHGWNVGRLKSVLAAILSRSQDRAKAQQAVLEALNADRVPAEDLVKEAMAQDQALDAFESFVCKKVEEHIKVAEHQMAEIDARILALQADRTHLAAHMQSDRDKLHEWRKDKRTYERDLASTLGYLTDRPVITTDDLPG